MAAQAVGAKGFARTLEAFSGIAGRRVDFVMRKLAFDALDGMFRRSPVDTGRFRASWRVSLDSADLSVAEPLPEGTKSSKPQGTPVEGDALAQFGNIKPEVKRDRTIVISNNLPYAVEIENQHSPQAPAGVLEITFFEVSLRLTRAIAASQAAVPDA